MLFYTSVYLRCISPAFMNERTRSLRLFSARFFQDSSMAMEAFLSNLSASPALREFTLSKQVEIGISQIN